MPIIHTIGYEGLKPEQFTDALQNAGVGLLVDVRAVAWSRKPGFSKQPLTATMRKVGIDYLHLPQLGNPKTGRTAAKEGRGTDFHAIYLAALDEPEARCATDHLLKLMHDTVLCLMCFERDPATCHRSILAGTLAERGATIEHISTSAVPRRVDVQTAFQF